MCFRLDSVTSHADKEILQCNNFAPDVTTNFYNLYPLDIARIKHLEVNAFSFSLSWTRIYPLGSGYLNEPGLAFVRPHFKRRDSEADTSASRSTTLDRKSVV